MLRAAKPKLSLSVPTTISHSAGPKSPFPLPVSPSPINSPTARNTALNARYSSTLPPALQQPAYQQMNATYALSSSTKSILKKGTSSGAGKKIAFREEPTITCVSPMPPGYHGEYVKMSRDEKRWGRPAHY